MPCMVSTGRQAFVGDTGERIYRVKLGRAAVGLQASSVAEEVEAEGEPDSAMPATTLGQEGTNARGRTAPKSTLRFSLSTTIVWLGSSPSSVPNLRSASGRRASNISKQHTARDSSPVCALS